jgi:hypothetical protein
MHPRALLPALLATAALAIFPDQAGIAERVVERLGPVTHVGAVSERSVVVATAAGSLAALALGDPGSGHRWHRRVSFEDGESRWIGGVRRRSSKR